MTWLLFEGPEYYPMGGIEDLVAAFETEEALESAANSLPDTYRNWQQKAYVDPDLDAVTVMRRRHLLGWAGSTWGDWEDADWSDQ